MHTLASSLRFSLNFWVRIWFDLNVFRLRQEEVARDRPRELCSFHPFMNLKAQPALFPQGLQVPSVLFPHVNGEFAPRMDGPAAVQTCSAPVFALQPPEEAVS